MHRFIIFYNKNLPLLYERINRNEVRINNKVQKVFGEVKLKVNKHIVDTAKLTK